MLPVFPGPQNLLAQMAGVLLPLPHDTRQAQRRAGEFCHAMPFVQRWLLAAVIGMFFLAARLLPGDAVAFDAAVAAWVSRAADHRFWWLRSLALWVKAVAALVVLGDPQARARVQGASAAAPAGDDAEVADAAKKAAAAHVRLGPPIADYIIVGTGPAGATVARTLALAGHAVLMLEEGETPYPAGRDEAFVTTLARRFRGAGTTATVGNAPMPVLQGRGVGGSSIVNSAIAWRAPDAILAAWHKDPAVAAALPSSRWERAYAEIERLMPVLPTPESAWSANNALMAKACRSLGMAGGPTPRYVTDCEGSGRCMEGCPRHHKQTMGLTLIPQACAAGARVWPGVQVERVAMAGGRANGVWARIGGVRQLVEARRGVVLAASAVQTPILLRNTGLRHAALGQHFQAHPGVSVAARFPERVRDRPGATQGYDSTHLAQHEVKLETLHLPDELLATRIGGIGAPWADAITRHLPHTALWAALVRAEAQGSVGGRCDMPVVHYAPSVRDAQRLAMGIRTLCGMFLAAGAEVVWPQVAGCPAEITNMDALRGLEDGIRANRLTMIASHLFGTAVMGRSADHAVCDPHGRVHGVADLWVADSSLFVSNLGVNPQHTIMALAQHVAWGMVEGQTA